MIKWIILVIVLVTANAVIKPIVLDSNQVLITDELAVSQVEDSDMNFIMSRASNRSSNTIDNVFMVGSIGLVFMTLYTDRKKISERIKNL